MPNYNYSPYVTEAEKRFNAFLVFTALGIATPITLATLVPQIAALKKANAIKEWYLVVTSQVGSIRELRVSFEFVALEYPVPCQLTIPFIVESNSL